MFQIRIDPTGTHQVRWPVSDAEIIALGQTVLAAERALPLDQQYPQLNSLEIRLTQASLAAVTANKAEAERTLQSDAEKTAFDTARMLTRRLITVLKARYINLALLEEWGVEVVGTGTAVRTRAPKYREDMIHMLDRYIAKESSLPAGQQNPFPPLAEVITARDALTTAHAGRVSATSNRELAVYQRINISQTLLRVLQLIAHHHITMDFGGVVDQNLQKLGYDVVATRTNSHTNGNISLG